MAGHSKWANIKHKKAREDAKRGKLFTKLVKKISSAARRGGGDPETNPELRLAVQKAKDANMPSDNIERAILKATGQLPGVTYEDFHYEGYGPGGVAIMMDGSTDNKNRTVANLRHILSKHGGNLGQDGCVSWMFETKGLIQISEENADADELMEIALEYGAEDFEHEDGVITITTSREAFPPVRDALGEAGYTDFITDEVGPHTDNTMTPDNLSDAKKVMKIIDTLEDDDDVEEIAHNLEMTDELAAALEDDG